jgi:hypothetical protein
MMSAVARVKLAKNVAKLLAFMGLESSPFEVSVFLVVYGPSI